MKLRLECDVDSLIELPDDIDVNWFGRQVYFKRDDKGVFSHIRIEGSLPDYPNSSITYKQEGAGIRIDIDISHEHQSALLSDLQVIEGVFAFFEELSRIRWDTATMSLVPEASEEEKRATVYGIRIGPNPNRSVRRIPIERFEDLMAMSHACRDLSTVLAFFREGLNDLDTSRYISAFYNFYFVIEGLYGNRKTDNRAVKAEFKKSKLLRACIKQQILSGWPRPYREDLPTIDDMLKRVQKPADVDGIIHLLVFMRGDLHHFVNSPTKPTGSPLTQHNYASLALFALA